MDDRDIQAFMLASSKSQGATEQSLLHIDRDLDDLNDRIKTIETMVNPMPSILDRLTTIESRLEDTSIKKLKSAAVIGASGGTVTTAFYFIGWLIKGITTGDWKPPMSGGN